jgi:ketosteroid isomerase-like protein
MSSLSRHAARLRIATSVVLLAMGAVGADAADGASIDAVWAKEDAYWQLSKAGDVDVYLALWHADAVAWPPDTEQPLSKAALARRLAEPGRPRLGLASPLTREAAQDFGGTVIVYYEAAQQRSYPDGHTDAIRRVKVTHVWKKVGADWLLIGGQAAPL